MTEPASKKKPLVVGIDLGTTHSAIAYVDDRGEPQTVANSEGDRTTPSVALIEQEEVTVGKQAVKAQITLPDHVAVFAKRDIGKPTLSHPVDGRELSPELVESFILRRLKDDAQSRLGRPIQDAVITVPAYFNEPKRRSTIRAAELAGLNCIGIVNEPTAAAIAYGLETHSQIMGPQTVIVYDLGGGTFDVSMVRVDHKDIKVIGTDGNAMLGGMDWDRCLVKWIDDQFHSRCRFRPSEADSGPSWLMQEAMELKHALTARSEVKVRLTFLGHSIDSVITREQFEELTAHLLDRTRFTVKKLMRDSNMQWDAIDQVILVGGSTRLPQVSDMLLALTGMEPNVSISADEAIAHGAAIYAATLHDRNTRLAKQRSKTDSLDSRDANANSNNGDLALPTESDALESDASDTSIDLMAEIADESGEPSTLGLVISDVNAHNLCVLGIDLETRLRCNHVMIARNSPLPAKQVTRFQTVRERQKNVVVDVVEGGDSRGRYGTRIGRCVLGNLPKDLPVGTPVDVTFRYDRDGLMRVQAKLPLTGQRASIEIQRNLSGEPTESIQDGDPEWSIHS